MRPVHLEAWPEVASRTASGSTQPLSLRQNFIWTLVGSVVYMACQWGMLVVLARLGSPETVGIYALGLAIAGPVIQFTNLQLRGILATDARDEFSFADYLALRLLMTGGGVLAIALFLVVSRGVSTGTAVILAVTAAKAVESISDIMHGRLQYYQRMNTIAVSLVTRGLVSLAALYLAFRASGQLALGLCAVIVSWAAVLTLIDIPAVSRQEAYRGGVSRPRWAWPRLWRLAVMSAPLGVVMLLGALTANLPRYYLAHYNGTGDLGIFAAAAYLVLVGSAIVGALGQSASPVLAQSLASGDTHRFHQLLWRLLGIGALLATAGILVSTLAGRFFLDLVYGAAYARGASALNWAMAAAGVGYVSSFLGYALTAQRCIKGQAALSGIVTSATAGACVLLVPSRGLTGAAQAMFVGAAVQLLGCSVLSLREAYRGRISEGAL